MRKSLLITCIALLGFLIVPQLASAQYNNWSVGFRIGEPSGANVRKYFGNNKALDLNIGTYGGIYGTKPSYRSGEYKNVGLTIQGHLIWHTALTKSESIRAYYGFGGQINTRRYYPPRLNGEYENALSIGPSGIGGLEVFPASKPYSFFLETGAYVELLQAPVLPKLEFGSRLAV